MIFFFLAPYNCASWLTVFGFWHINGDYKSVKVSTLKEKGLLLVGFQSFKTASIVCVCFFVSSVFMEQYPTEEDMIEWAKRESEREEKERLARLTQQEQEDLELAIALSKSELSWGGPVPLYRSGSARHGTAWPGPAQKAPKQSGDCTGLIQHHLLTPWRDSKLISNSFNPPTVHALLVSVVLIEERNVFSFPFLERRCKRKLVLVLMSFCLHLKSRQQALR